ncbi:hypothetical protein CaCOL14_011020 [Colletotrichum acutatum]
MATLNDLPPEIVHQLFPSSSLLEQFCVTKSDADLAKEIQPAWSSALNLSRTCKKYRNMLAPELYRHISIHGSNSFQKLKCFIQFLINNKDVAFNIRRLYLHLDPSNTETKGFTEADLEWSHWAARQSGAPSPYYLWHSEDGKLLQMSESRRSRTRILHLGILLEIILSRVHGLQELGLAVPGGLFCDQYGPWSRTELDGLLWTGEPGPSDPLKIRTFRGVQRPLPNIKTLANTTTILITLCLDLNDWYRGEYEAIRSLSDFNNLENLWVDASTVLKKVKYGSFSRSEKHKRLTHKLSISLPPSIKRLHLAGNEPQVRHNMCEVLTDRKKFPNLRLVELEDFIRRFPELWDRNEEDSDEDDAGQNDIDDAGGDLTFSAMNDGDGNGGGSYLQDGNAKEEDIGETIQDTKLSYQERFIRAGIESPSTVCTLGELW